MAKNITITTTFTAGAGWIVLSGVDGAGGDVRQTCDPANPVSPQTLNVDQSEGPQGFNVSGTAPAGGSIEVDVSDGANQLATGTYNGLFNNEDLVYNVNP